MVSNWCDGSQITGLECVVYEHRSVLLTVWRWNHSVPFWPEWHQHPDIPTKVMMFICLQLSVFCASIRHSLNILTFYWSLWLHAWRCGLLENIIYHFIIIWLI